MKLFEKIIILIAIIYVIASLVIIKYAGDKIASNIKDQKNYFELIIK